AEGLSPHPTFFRAMIVPDDGARLVGQLMAGLNHREERTQVIATACWRSGAEGIIKPTDAPQSIGSKRHVGAGAELAGSIRIQPAGWPMGGQIIEPSLEALAEAAVPLGPVLRARFKLSRKDQAGDACDRLVRHEL